MAEIYKKNNRLKESYGIRVVVGRNGEGKPIRKNMTWTPPAGMKASEKKRELARVALEFENKMLRGITNEKFTFRQVSEQFLESAAENLKATTISDYTIKLSEANHVFGHLPIDKITKQTIRDYIKVLQKPRRRIDKRGNKVTLKALSPSSVQGYFKVVSLVLSYACEQDIIETNICLGAGIKLPTAKNKAPKILSPEEMTAILDAIGQYAPLQYKAFFQLLSVTGARRGELLGLKWSDVDFEKGTINICETAHRLPGKGIFFTTPKTDSSVRTITVAPNVLEVLRKHQLEQKKQRLKVGELWQCDPDHPAAKYCERHHSCNSECTGFCTEPCNKFVASERVFLNDYGIPLSPDTPLRWLKRFSEDHHLPKTDIHTFRHTAISKLIANGHAATLVAGLVGHSNPRITMEVYAHSIKKEEEKLSSELAEAFEL